MRRRRAGFTLIELVLVVIIVGLMALLAATRMEFLVPKYRLRGAAREVASTFKQARGKAVGSGKDVYVEFDLSQSRYWLLVAFPRERQAEDAPVVYEYQPTFGRTLPDGVQFVDVLQGAAVRDAEGVARVRVSPFGGSDHVIVNLRNEEGREISLKANGFTGSVTFTDHYMEAQELLEDSSY